jgi:hypothetical protein
MTDQSASITPTKLPRGRSPNYPGISLPAAIDRARTLYEYAQQHPVPRATISSRWGFKNPNSGSASVTYAALTKFGLMEDVGKSDNRQGHITSLGVEVLVPNPNQEQAIKKAALLPPIHQEFFQRFGSDLPPDETLRFEFVAQGPFTGNGFTEFLREYRETIAFAKLEQGATVRNDGTANQPEGGYVNAPPHISDGRTDMGRVFKDPEYEPKDPAVTAIPVLLPSGDKVTIEGRFPIPEADWDQMMVVLNAMKLGMVRDTPQPSDDEP